MLTRFFYHRVLARKKKNKISKLKDEKRIVYKGVEELERVASGYFVDLFMLGEVAQNPIILLSQQLVMSNASLL